MQYDRRIYVISVVKINLYVAYTINIKPNAVWKISKDAYGKYLKPKL
jgi:hypothetical protein